MWRMGSASCRAYGPALGVALLLGLITTTDLRGQAPWPPRGTSVRVTYPCDLDSSGESRRPSSTCRVVGEFLEAEAGTVTLLADGSSRTFGLDAVRQLEVSRGSRTHRLVGFAAGFALGSGATYLVLYQGGSTSRCDRSANQDAMSSGECLGLTALGGVAMGVLGGVVGGFIRSERWEDLGVEALRVMVAPGGRVGIGFSLTR